MSNFMKIKKYSATKKFIALRNLLVVTIAFALILSNLFILKVDATPEGTRSVVIWTTDSNFYTSDIGTYFSKMSTFYQEKNATASTIFGGHLSSDSLSGVNLLWVFLPNADFTEDDITYMSNFLSTGGRIVFCGEHSGIFSQGNIYISGAIAKLGGSFAIINQNHTPNSGIITGDNINGASNLTNGLTGYYYAVATKVSYSGSTQIVINGMDDSPMVVDQAVGNGRITLFTDINNWDPVFSNSTTQGNSQVLFENLLIDAQANQAIVAAGGNPNVGFGGSPSYTITANADIFGQASASKYIFRVEYKVADGSTATFHSQQFDDNDVTVKNASGVSFIVHKDTSIGAGTGIVSGEGTNDVVVQYTVVAPDGTWDDIDEGTYTIGIVNAAVEDSDGKQIAGNSAATSFNVTIAQIQTYSVAGTIKYSNNNSVSGAAIILSDTAGSLLTYSGTTDENGNYNIIDVPNGSYIITVTENNEIIGSSSVMVMDSNVSDANVTVSLPIGIAYTVSGTIKYSNNNTVSGAAITYINRSDSTKTYAALSDRDGNYAITDVPNGSYIITVTENNETLGSSSVTVMDSNVTDANVTISLPTDITYTVSGTIKYSNNITVSGAVVAMINKVDSTKTYSTLSDTNGNYTITGVQDGSYIIIVTKGRAYGSGSITVNGSDVTDESGNVTLTTSTSTPTSSPVSTPVAPTTQTEEITADIKIDDSQVIASIVTILRKTEVDGRKTDTVIYQEDKAKETIEILLKEGKDTARIVIPDEKDEIFETNVRIPSSALNLFAASNISLEIDTENARLSIPKESIQNASNASTEELFFHIIPIKKEEEKAQVIERAKLETVIIDAIKGSAISVIGRPMTIETNMISTAVDITLPLNDVVIPTDAKAREEFLSKLAVYIEHSDGEKELVRGEIVEYKDGVLGIKFRITKFSIFTIVKADNLLQKSNACKLANVISPTDTTLKGTKLSLTVNNKITKVKVNVTVSKNATWKLYSDVACKKVISSKNVKLKVGKNKAYIKVTAEDGTSAKVYTVTVTRGKKVVTKKVKNKEQ